MLLSIKDHKAWHGLIDTEKVSNVQHNGHITSLYFGSREYPLRLEDENKRIFALLMDDMITRLGPCIEIEIETGEDPVTINPLSAVQRINAIRYKTEGG